MNEKDLMRIKESFILPSAMVDTLAEGCTVSGNHQEGCRRFSPRTRSANHRLHSCRYRRLCAAAAALFCILAAGSTSLAYNVYQEKQLAVFMEPELTQAEIDYIGQKIAGIREISSCQYVNGDEAWEEFKAAYLTDENGVEIASFEENPLADSFNYRVSVRLNADTQAVREQIGSLPGVRKITTVREAEADQASRAE